MWDGQSAGDATALQLAKLFLRPEQAPKIDWFNIPLSSRRLYEEYEGFGGAEAFKSVVAVFRYLILKRMTSKISLSSGGPCTPRGSGGR
jgi:hypothetical protein